MERSVDKKGIEILKALCYNTHIMQDSYIGNTTASQAVKAGSTPVSCSKTKRPPVGWSFGFLSGGGSRTDLNADVRGTSACRQLDGGNTIIFFRYSERKCKQIWPGVSRIAISKVYTNNMIRHLSTERCRISFLGPILTICLIYCNLTYVIVLQKLATRGVHIWTPLFCG